MTNSTHHFRDTIRHILSSHGRWDEFNALLEDTAVHPDSALWSVQISPREGQSTFSKPLIIATESIDGHHFIRVAHSWADVWDTTYDPLYEFAVDRGSGTWVPTNVYSSMDGGFRVFTTDAEVQAAVVWCHGWAETLRQRGYADVSQAVAVVLRDTTPGSTPGGGLSSKMNAREDA